MQKKINICCCSFNKISMKRKKSAAKNFDLTINFDVMINFHFFDLITWDSLMVWAWNLVCGRFMNFQNGREFLTLLTFVSDLVALLISDSTNSIKIFQFFKLCLDWLQSHWKILTRLNYCFHSGISQTIPQLVFLIIQARESSFNLSSALR